MTPLEIVSELITIREQVEALITQVATQTLQNRETVVQGFNNCSCSGAEDFKVTSITMTAPPEVIKEAQEFLANYGND